MVSLPECTLAKPTVRLGACGGGGNDRGAAASVAAHGVCTWGRLSRIVVNVYILSIQH